MTKWISTKAKYGSSAVTFHTVERCRHLQRADNYRPISDDEIEWHEAEECDNCKILKEEG